VDYPAELREQLRCHGYAPLPLNGKRPPMEGWQQKSSVNPEEIALWSKLYPHCGNTGVLTRLTPTLDIDLLDEAAAAAIEDLARDRFEDRGYFLVRIGRAPKRAILFRTLEPFKKMSLVLTAPNGAVGKIEVLADGQQVVVDGIHPETCRPYCWHGGEPWRIAAEELPYVSKADMEAFVADAGALLAREHGYQVSRAGAAKENGADAAGAGGREWGDCLNAIRQGTDQHDGIAVLAAKLLTSGMTDGAAVNLIRALVGACDAPHDERWRSRYDDIGRAVTSARAKFDNTAAERATELYWYSNDQAEKTTRAWLVDELLPEIGTGLASGQWGTYKTFVALDLAAAVMAGISFINAPVARRGGVLFLAAEGAREIPIRLRAVLKDKYAGIERVPFAWTENCPRLAAANAGEALTDLARAAHARMVADFGLPLALIVIDTIGSAAGYSKNGDENDAAINQAIMSRLAALSRTTGALVLGIDHFGKAVETGTRGSSAKEAAADVVLALLGDRNIGGVVTNTHLALRKSRAGPSGAEYPFTVRLLARAMRGGRNPCACCGPS
jgi:hypothetical protein